MSTEPDTATLALDQSEIPLSPDKANLDSSESKEGFHSWKEVFKLSLEC